MGYVSTQMGDHFGALLLSLMALWLTLVDRNPFQPCLNNKKQEYVMKKRHLCTCVITGLLFQI